MDVKRADKQLKRAPGTIASFVPAHGDSRAGVVARQLSRTRTEGHGVAVLLADFDTRGYSLWDRSQTPRSLDRHSWGTFVTEAEGLDTLDARETPPRQLVRLLDHARQNYSTIFADLTGAREAHALEVLRASDAIFLVTDSDRTSIEAVREKAEWLRSIHVIDRVGLLVRRAPAGLEVNEIEDLTGVPLCSLIDTHAQIEQLASWLAANANSGQQDTTYALAG